MSLSSARIGARLQPQFPWAQKTMCADFKSQNGIKSTMKTIAISEQVLNGRHNCEEIEKVSNKLISSPDPISQFFNKAVPVQTCSTSGFFLDNSKKT